LTALHVSNDIFAHHQEHLNCNYSFWLSHDSSRQQYMRVKPEALITIKMLLMMKEIIA
jgi:hypothetical protein